MAGRAHLTFDRCDRHWPFRLTPAASGHGRLRGLAQSARQAFSPVLPSMNKAVALSMRLWRVSALLTALTFST
jgi:hypothetical protein